LLFVRESLLEIARVLPGDDIIAEMNPGRPKQQLPSSVVMMNVLKCQETLTVSMNLYSRG